MTMDHQQLEAFNHRFVCVKFTLLGILALQALIIISTIIFGQEWVEDAIINEILKNSYQGSEMLVNHSGTGEAPPLRSSTLTSISLRNHPPQAKSSPQSAIIPNSFQYSNPSSQVNGMPLGTKISLSPGGSTLQPNMTTAHHNLSPNPFDLEDYENAKEFFKILIICVFIYELIVLSLGIIGTIMESLCTVLVYDVVSGLGNLATMLKLHWDMLSIVTLLLSTTSTLLAIYYAMLISAEKRYLSELWSAHEEAAAAATQQRPLVPLRSITPLGQNAQPLNHFKNNNHSFKSKEANGKIGADGTNETKLNNKSGGSVSGGHIHLMIENDRSNVFQQRELSGEQPSDTREDSNLVKN